MGPEPLSIGPMALTLLTSTVSSQCGPTLLALAVPTTVYLCAKGTFSVGTCSAFVSLTALPVLGTGFNLIAS